MENDAMLTDAALRQLADDPVANQSALAWMAREILALRASRADLMLRARQCILDLKTSRPQCSCAAQGLTCIHEVMWLEKTHAWLKVFPSEG